MFGKVFIVLSFIQLISGYRILCIFPVPFRDQQVIFRPLIDKLLNRGHQLTIVTTDPISNLDNVSGIDQIDLSFVHKLDIVRSLSQKNELSVKTVFNVLRQVAEAELEQLQELLKNANNTTVQYDATIVDWSGPSLMNAFAKKFEVPLIGITPGGAYMYSNEAMGNPNHPSAFPSILMPFSENLNLYQRIVSAYFTFKYRYLYFNEELPLQNELAKKYFGSNLPDLWQIQSNADLFLVNQYPELGNSRPICPKTIYLGGIHSTSTQPLPWDLKYFLDASLGAIYINLGFAETKALFTSPYRLHKMLSVLEELHYDVIWNLNGLSVAINTTANIYYGSIMRQEDVLAHKNVRVFITVGGQRDIEDAIHHSVPVLGFTSSSLIEHYLLQILKYDAGVIVNFDKEDASIFKSGLANFASTDNRYHKNIHRLHCLLRDKPMTPLETAVWWIEYTIRNGGTPHFNNQLNSMHWFTYLLLDVILAAFFTILIFFTVIFYVAIKLKRYSNSLPFEKFTSRTKYKVL